MNTRQDCLEMIGYIKDLATDIQISKRRQWDADRDFIKKVQSELKLAGMPDYFFNIEEPTEEFHPRNINVAYGWNGEYFTFSIDSDEPVPLLSTTAELRSHFVNNILPKMIYDMVDYLRGEKERLDSLDEQPEEDLIPDEMSEQDKDFMMMDGWDKG